MNGNSARKVLVTGAGGFIGRHCLPKLAADGFTVFATDIRSAGGPSPKWSWQAADLMDFRQTRDLLASTRPTHLLHLAWCTRPNDYRDTPDNLRWVSASLNLIHEFRAGGGERAVLAGTCAEYDWSNGFCVEGFTPLSSASLYGISKDALRRVLEAFSRVSGLSSAWGRVFFLYGPGEDPDRLIPSVILNLLRDKAAPCSHGGQVRDFLYVEDVASAFVSLLGSPVEGPVNISSGCGVALRELVLAAAAALGRCENVRFGALQAPPGEPSRIIGENRRLVEEVGWRPAFDLTTGIARTVRYWKEKVHP
ncbi:MAG: NAD(P)-dependent oxidoreductase [Acidobacteria bacterium]|nr:NAD(P)-dependent oxidoreductase [Acidobacteriota bacterium]